jgi:hypothetical protein
MKKTFPLHVPSKEDRRVMDAIKLEITKYVKRERRKTLPLGTDFWDFSCQVGADSGTAAKLPLAYVPKAVEAVALADQPEVYVEILASPGCRVQKAPRVISQRRES